MTAIDWDGWRAGYDAMTWADQQAFYAKVVELHRETAGLWIRAA